ncbi:MAG: hypothetical protein JWN98_942 [Abditibacteriota bacterium]|nr:hypothetical protein [Abditibacteriota bacterium]
MNKFQDSPVATSTGTTPDADHKVSDDKIGFAWLALAALVTIVAWRLPYGNYMVYPFTILATWFHEMGHGLTAMLTGGRFEKLILLPDGSGIATNWASADNSLWARVQSALIAAGGPLGPALAGAAFIVASRRFQTSRIALILLGGLMLLSVLIWVRSLFGFVAIGLWGALIVAIAFKGSRWMQGFAIQLLGVQACLSTWQQLDYLFSAGAVIGGQSMPSDSSQIAQNLLLPYWFWGAAMAGVSALLLLGSLYVAYRPRRVKTPSSILDEKI